MRKNLQVSFAGHLSDRLQDLYYGVVEPDSIDLQYIELPPFQAFNRMLRGEFDSAEMSLSTYVLLASREPDPALRQFVALPIFPARTFRHNAIYIRRNAGISVPAELKGKRIGVPEYQMTAAVWARGMLLHEYGVHARDIDWTTGGLTQPGRAAMLATNAPGVSITHEASRTLDEMLVTGDLDAIISPQKPPSFNEGQGDVVRLFPDYARVEREYFAKTGIFPIMHTVVVRRDLLDRHPWVAVSLFEAFEQARQSCMKRLAQYEPSSVSVPWFNELQAEVRSVMGSDFWPYGVSSNRKTIEALCSYVVEQGLATRQCSVEELFAPSVLGLDSLKL